MVSTCLAVASVPAGAEVESGDPIKLTLHDWTGQLVTTKIMGEVLKKAGYNIEYVQADYIAQFAGLKTGDLHVAMEIWETTGRDAMDEATATGKVENLGETGMQAIEEWWYPAYMKEKCPGLPKWEALKDEACAEAFATARNRARRAAISADRCPGKAVMTSASNGAGPAVRGRPCRHRRVRSSPNWNRPISARRRSCCGSMPRTGRQ